MASDEILTVKQVAERVHLSERAVQQLCKEGVLKAFKVSSKAWVILRPDLDAFIEERRQEFIDRLGKRGRPLK